MPTLIVFSHRRWGFVPQRTQQLMTRLARHYRVVVVEEPVRGEGVPRFDRVDGGRGVEVLCPRTPIEAAGLHYAQMPPLGSLLAAWLREHGIGDVIAWLDTPMALPLLGSLAPRAVIYDCIDAPPGEAPRELQQRESALLGIASLVFANGPALYDAKRGLHRHVHCLPDAVDAACFAPCGLDAASEHARAAAQLHAALPRPRLGCFGPIDERIDFRLLDALADARPAWPIVMAGPLAGGVDREALPQRPNLHWLGPQPEARLPYLMPHWDVCLLPWTPDTAARAAGATRALEYLAGEKAVVSSALPDVVALHGDVVRIARDAAGFIAACDAALAEGRERRGRRNGETLAAVMHLSWERSAESVHALIEQVLRPSADAPAKRRPLPGWPLPADAVPHAYALGAALP